MRKLQLTVIGSLRSVSRVSTLFDAALIQLLNILWETGLVRVQPWESSQCEIVSNIRGDSTTVFLRIPGTRDPGASATSNIRATVRLSPAAAGHRVATANISIWNASRR